MTFDAPPTVIVGTHPRAPRVPGEALQDSPLTAPCHTCHAPTGQYCAPDCAAARRLLDHLHGQIAAVRRPCLVCGAGEREACKADVLSIAGYPDTINDVGSVSLGVYESLIEGRYADVLTVELDPHSGIVPG